MLTYHLLFYEAQACRQGGWSGCLVDAAAAAGLGSFRLVDLNVQVPPILGCRQAAGVHAGWSYQVHVVGQAFEMSLLHIIDSCPIVSAVAHFPSFPLTPQHFPLPAPHSSSLPITALLAYYPAAGGRLVFMLEGGYQVDAVGEAVSETFLGLLGEPSQEGRRPLQLPHEEPLPEVRRLVRELRSIHGL